MKRRGIVAVISDFQAEGYERALGILRRRHDVIALHLQDPREAELPDAGLVALLDPETGERRRGGPRGPRRCAGASSPDAHACARRILPPHACRRPRSRHRRFLRAAPAAVLRGPGAPAMKPAGSRCSPPARSAPPCFAPMTPTVRVTASGEPGRGHGGGGLHGRGRGERARRARPSASPPRRDGELRARDAEPPSPDPDASLAPVPREARYEARVFALGEAALPPLTVRYRLPDGTAARRPPRPSRARAPLLPKDPQEQTLADIRAPCGSPSRRAFWIALALAGRRGALAFWHLARARAGSGAGARRAPSRPCRRRGGAPALDALAGLRRARPRRRRGYYIALTAIAKRYLERRLDAPILEMTTAEMLAHLRDAPHGRSARAPHAGPRRGRRPHEVRQGRGPARGGRAAPARGARPGGRPRGAPPSRRPRTGGKAA